MSNTRVTSRRGGGGGGGGLESGAPMEKLRISYVAVKVTPAYFWSFKQCKIMITIIIIIDLIN